MTVHNEWNKMMRQRQMCVYDELAAILQFHRFRISGAEWLIGKLPQILHTLTNAHIHTCMIHRTAEASDKQKLTEKGETQRQKKWQIR